MYKLLYACVSDKVQRYIDNMSPAPTTIDELVKGLNARYGRSIRQVEAELVECK